MRIFNWAERFKEQPTCEDVLKKVRKTETAYWIFMVIFILVGLHGLNTIAQASEDNLKQHIMGLFDENLGTYSLGNVVSNLG